jgi:hypothetical protein
MLFILLLTDKGYVNSDGYNRTDEDQASTSTNGKKIIS